MVAALPYAWASRARACRCRERLRPRVLRPTAPRLSLWQESLTGNSKTAMLVTVAPTQSAAAVAGAALEFGVKARILSPGPTPAPRPWPLALPVAVPLPLCLPKSLTPNPDLDPVLDPRPFPGARCLAGPRL